MAAHAVIDPGNPFFPMFGNDVRLLMLVAAEACILLVVTAHVTCLAGLVVISIQDEEATVIECRWFPSRRLVAGCADRLSSLVQLVQRRPVASLASGPRIVL